MPKKTTPKNDSKKSGDSQRGEWPRPDINEMVLNKLIAMSKDPLLAHDVYLRYEFAWDEDKSYQENLPDVNIEYAALVYYRNIEVVAWIDETREINSLLHDKMKQEGIKSRRELPFNDQYTYKISVIAVDVRCAYEELRKLGVDVDDFSEDDSRNNSEMIGLFRISKNGYIYYAGKKLDKVNNQMGLYRVLHGLLYSPSHSMTELEVARAFWKDDSEKYKLDDIKRRISDLNRDINDVRRQLPNGSKPRNKIVSKAHPDGHRYYVLSID